MKVQFLGTRGEIELRTDRHRRHSSMLVAYRGFRVALDWGLDWRGRLDDFRPAAIVLTHAHPDHAGGLRDGTRCPVYATAETWSAIERYPIERREVVDPRRRTAIGPLGFEAFPVEHSVIAPAVAYRITAGRVSIVYAPDLVSIPQRAQAMTDVSVYIGDGASISRAIIRRRDGVPIGHASIREQLDWCAAEGVRRAIFTHCGSQILKDEDGAAAAVRALAHARGIDAEIAFDGLELLLR